MYIGLAIAPVLYKISSKLAGPKVYTYARCFHYGLQAISVGSDWSTFAEQHCQVKM